MKKNQHQASRFNDNRASIIERQVILPDTGKTPPQAQELEEAVLAALMTEPKAIDRINLRSDDFYNQKHQVIFTAITRIREKREPVDLLTVMDELKATGTLEEAGGVAYLAEVSDKISSASHIEHHAAIIKQKAIARRIIAQSYNVIQKAYDETEDVQDVMEYLESSFTELRTGSTASHYIDAKTAVKRTLNYLVDIQDKKQRGETVAIPTGLNALDQAFNGGWTAPDLVIIGGRPSMGKTQFALHFAKTAAAHDKHCLFISIEMTVEQLIMRILTEDERIHLYDMKKGQLDSEQWRAIDEKIKEFENSTLYIADDHNIRNLTEIKANARKLHREGQLDMLVIDYLQLIKTNMQFGTRDLEIGYITGELKNLAKELNIPVILLAQLSRPSKGARVQLPVLSDLRESGNIEQDADKVIFPHRPSYYDPNARDKYGNSWENRGVLIIGKDREGIKDQVIHFKTDDRFKKIFDDIERDYRNENYSDEPDDSDDLPF
jgi:replicative DNA helicase